MIAIVALLAVCATSVHRSDIYANGQKMREVLPDTYSMLWSRAL